jgi:hypothetical protein
MKSTMAGVAAVAGLALTAHAATTVSILVSRDGVNFSQHVGLSSNSGVQQVQVLVSVSTSNTAALGLGSMIFQPVVTSWSATDQLVPFTAPFGSNTSTPAGSVPDATLQYGRISPFAAVSMTSSQRLTGHVHLNGSSGAPTGSNFLRIAQAQVTGWIGTDGNTSGGSGVNIKQLSNIGRTASDPAFNTTLTNVHVFRFGLLIDTGITPRAMSVDIPLAGMGNLNTTTGNREVYWYGDLNEASGSIREVPTIAQGTIDTGIPSAATVFPLSLGVLAATRRRR